MDQAKRARLLIPEPAAVPDQAVLAAQLGLTEQEAQPLVVQRSQRLPTGGSVVQLEQRVHGLPVFRGRASVALDAQGQLVAVANHLVANLPVEDDDQEPSLASTSEPQPQRLVGASRDSFALQPEAAIAQLYAAHSGVQLTASDVHARAAASDKLARFDLSTAERAPAALEATLKRVYFPRDAELIPAYHAELLLRDVHGLNHGFGAVIDARTQEAATLWSADLSANEAFSYRVWAEPDGLHIPTDGPLLDATPYPGAAPDRKRPDFRAPITVSIDGFNHNPQGQPDPWLASSATQSTGNNVSAYTDRDEYTTSLGLSRKDGFTTGDVRATTTAAQTFDYTYDVTRAPNADASQMKAAVTQVFYVTNWLHDYWYDSGFNEKAGNAQADNFGRGGEGADPLHAEAQDSADSGASNNANMSVLSDGSSPRMQMYVWNGLPVRALTTEPALSFEDELGAAGYGPQTFELNGDLVLVNDGSEAVDPSSTSGTTMMKGSVTDACQSMTGLSGRIAVVERGGCAFLDKIDNLQRAQATAVLILDNAPGHTAVSPSVDDPPDVTLPLLALSYEDGQKVKAALQAAGETPLRAARFYRGVETMRDGTIDNSVVAHEWGHYLHHRLVDCSSLSCSGMSEGWGDFVALMMVIRDGDSFDNQVFPLAQYATGGLNQNSAYFGTRRAPYSTDLSKNPFTFKHIREASELPTGAPLTASSPDMNEVHNVGEIWAVMMFEAYVNVIKAGQAAGRPFAESQRRMADYVVAGMQVTPADPTFTEQRDAILTAARTMARDDATRQADVDAIEQGFAKRGLGAGAIAPPADSSTLNEAVESFTTTTNAGRTQP